MTAQNTLALLGGTPVRTKPFPAYKVIGEEEKQAAVRVIESGVLSRFLGAWHTDFFGGSEVQAFEKEWARSPHDAINSTRSRCRSGVMAINARS